MSHSELPSRYASALFLSANDAETRATFLSLLVELEKALHVDAEIDRFVETPLISPEKKERVLGEALKALQAPATFIDFIRLLADKGRISLVGEIAKAYQAKVDEQNHMVRGRVRSAGPLSEKERADVQLAVEKHCGGKVALDFSQDESLFGGLTVQVGSLTFDDSLSSHLNQIKEELTRGVMNQ